MIGQKSLTCIQEIFELTEGEEQTYYLCSNNVSSVSFTQYLYTLADSVLTPICSTSDFSEENLPADAAIVFNPEKKSWKFCEKKGETFVPVRGTPVLRLYLDGEDSFFRIDD